MIEPPRHPGQHGGEHETLPTFRGGLSLVLDRVSVSRGDVTVRDVNFSVNGGVVAFLGPNGCGKTTLLRVMATVAPLDAGTIRVDGLDLSEKANRQTVRSWLGYGPQATRFHSSARVFDAVDYVATLRLALDTRDRQREVWRSLDRFELRDLASTKIGELSEGNRQRVTLAQAVLGPPRIAILDEPLVALDPEIRLNTKAAITELANATTVVMATHFLDEAAALADLLVVFARPSEVADGASSILFTGSPAELASLGQGRVWEAPPGTFDTPGATSWRTEQGVLRGIGPRPLGAELAQPVAADGYLILQRGLLD